MGWFGNWRVSSGSLRCSVQSPPAAPAMSRSDCALQLSITVQPDYNQLQVFVDVFMSKSIIVVCIVTSLSRALGSVKLCFRDCCSRFICQNCSGVFCKPCCFTLFLRLLDTVVSYYSRVAKFL